MKYKHQKLGVDWQVIRIADGWQMAICQDEDDAILITNSLIGLEQMAQAFEAWENGFRAEPSQYLSTEECAAASVSKLSADRAAYFSELLAAAQEGKLA